MTTMIETRVESQPREALRCANGVRTARAQLKRDVKAGRCAVVDVIVCPPDCALTMTVMDLLIAMPKIGRSKATRLLSHCWLLPTKQLGELTERQTKVLCEALRAAYK